MPSNIPSSPPSAHVVVLGAGLVTAPLVRYLAKHGFRVTVASRTLSKAQQLCAQDGCDGRATAVQLDVEAAGAATELERLLRLPQTQGVVSMLPYIHHVQVAEAAIAAGVHFFSTSYISPAMQQLDSRARDKGLVLLNECGLDPGTDHMSAMRVIDALRRDGGELTSFTSICGGLPAPDSNTNPLGYKFSWAPRGVLLAGANEATFLRNGETVVASGEKLYGLAEKAEIKRDAGGGDDAKMTDLQLEQYANRNSLPFRDVYETPQASTFLRGTFRYQGWSTFMTAVSRLGLLDLSPRPQLAGAAACTLLLDALQQRADNDAPLPKQGDQAALRAAAAVAAGVPPDSSALDALRWLGLFDTDRTLGNGAVTRLDALCDLMQQRPEMQYQEGERDMVVMRHTFEASFPADNTTQSVTTTLLCCGTSQESAMATTVAIPMGVGVRLVLQGGLSKRCTGVQRPTLPELYNPILDELEKDHSVRFVDVYGPRVPAPQ